MPVLNVYSGAVQLSDAQLVAANILDAVQNELVYARPDREPEISEDGSLIEFNGVYPNTRITSAPAGRRRVTCILRAVRRQTSCPAMTSAITAATP